MMFCGINSTILTIQLSKRFCAFQKEKQKSCNFIWIFSSNIIENTDNILNEMLQSSINNQDEDKFVPLKTNIDI